MNATRYLVSTRREVGLPAYVFVLAFTFSHFVALSQRLSIMAAIRNELLLGVACLVIAIGVFVTDPVPLGAGRLVALSFAAFFVTVVIQVPFAMDRAAASYMFNEKILKQAIFVFYIAVLLRSPRHVALFLATYLFALFWIYQEAVRGLISGSLVWRNQGIQRLHGGVERYQHPNGLSLAALSCLPFLYFMRRVWTRRWMKFAMLACLILAILCIVNTGSRSGYVGFMALVLCIWLASQHKARNILLLAVLAAIVIAAVPQQYKQRFETIGGEEKEGASKEARILLMQDAWEIFLRHPLGIGVDSFIYARLATYGNGRGKQDVHNLYLQLLTHLGVQGMLCFIVMIYSIFRCHKLCLKKIGLATGSLRHGLRNRQFEADRYVKQFCFDLKTLEMSIRSVQFFTVMMLFNGLFAHTTYHIVWCFIVGVTIATASITEHLADVTREFWLRQQSELVER
jgi:putative inorganic carbon (hco3(-)) transporter